VTLESETRPWEGASPEGDLEHISTAELQAELARRQAQWDELQVRRRALLQQLEEVDRELRGIQNPGSVRQRGRSADVPVGADALPLPRRWESFDSLPLPEALTRLMSIGEVITPHEAAERLIAKGYGTRTKSLRTRVTQVLAGESRFRRVARGRYERCA
jgi:hypothetical protein